MAEFRSEEDVERWLQGRRREEAIVLVLRAALRVVPFLAAGALTSSIEDERGYGPFADAIVLPSFRCLAAAWVACRYPSRVSATRAAARAANAASRAAFGYPAAGAIAAVKVALAVTNHSTFQVAAEASQYADILMNAAMSGLGVGNNFHDFGWKAISADATKLGGFRNHVLLCDSPLWDKSKAPYWISKDWQELKTFLLAQNADWGVWTDWYEDRLIGKRPWRKALEIARVTLPDKVWKQGSKVVNAEIKWMIEAEKAKGRGRLTDRPEPPEDDDPRILAQAPSSHAFQWRGDVLEARRVSEPPFDPLLAETILEELRVKAAETLLALTGNNADDVVSRAVERLRDVLNLPAGEIAEGILLMRAETLAAHARSYADPKNARERAIRAVLDDLSASTGKLADCYPGLQKINANRLALNLQTDKAPEVEAQLRRLQEAAERNPSVGKSARAALDIGRADVDEFNEKIERSDSVQERADFLGARGKVVAARLLDAMNFVSVTIQKVEPSEFGGLSKDVWREIRKQVPKPAGRAVAKGAETIIEFSMTVAPILLVYGLVGPLAAIAVAVPMLKKHDRKLASVLARIAKGMGGADTPEG